ncbi:MAG: SDR family oxidoreductase [Oceanospirillaceae bacterium]|nr:SDR family oxidoreductase [Oceanospirillaceae bacterium]MCP5334460.1 SDR family oxidoreductase [Oceanospirillaceae bacterium]MCP5350832.1 SDR family oxidoreductase [Oceanospirillaceae bacterium]
MQANSPKTIFITGAASGIGAATARKFAAAGWQVGLADINADAMYALQKELGESAQVFSLNICDADAAAIALEAFTAPYQGKLQVLFNCAGLLEIAHFEEQSLARKKLLCEVNNIGMLTMTHQAFPYLKASGGAMVINMSSASASHGVPDFAVYSASKFWVRGFTQALNIEWKRHKIHVGDIMPPFVNTPMLQNAQHVSIIDRLGVDLKADDVADAVWQMVQKPVLHKAVSMKFKLLNALSQITPVRINHLVMRLLAGY